MSSSMAIRRLTWFVVAIFTAFFGVAAQGGLPIEIEVAMEPGVAITAPQEWARLLGKMDLVRVQVRSARPDDQPRITVRESATGSRVMVLAVLSQRNELILPERRFRSHDLATLRKYLEDLPSNAGEGSAERGRFDLTEKQFRTVHRDLSQKVDFSTQGKTVADLLLRLAKGFDTPLKRSPLVDALLSDAPLTVELRGMSAGTSLSLALRHEGLALRPEKPRGESLQMRVIRYDRNAETWPVGWKSQASPRQLAPKMFEYLNIEISGYSLAQALDALEPRLGIPVIMDGWILKREDIHPDQTQVKIPRGKTYLKKAVDRILSQARLAGELRVDELGTPFYWVTQYGKDSLRAEK